MTPNPVLARADALMQRRRPVNSENDDVPVLIDAIDPDSEIPVLLDIDLPVAVPATPVVPKARPEPARAPAVNDDNLDEIARELARRVHERLAVELPEIIETTIRDFLDAPEMRELLARRD